MPVSKLGAFSVAAVIAAAGLTYNLAGDGYTLQVVLPAATNLVKGSVVEIDGADAGSVTDLTTRDGKAVVTISLDDDYAPVHEGTTATISYKAALGERILELDPGEEKNASLTDGALVEGTVDRVELDQVLAALDGPTRLRLQVLLDRLSGTFEGREDEVRSTLRSAGPAVEALGSVLKALGTDGPAIRSLVTRLNSLTTTIADRRAQTSSSIESLTAFTGNVAAEQSRLREALQALPETLDVTRQTLDKVPGAVGAARPLLRDLRPGAELLPAVSRQLAPVLIDLRPTMAQLRPTLGSLRVLLGQTPALLQNAGQLVPDVDSVLRDLGPAVAYLRPYTPELVGWFSNWGSMAANYDENGHYIRAFAQLGSTSLNANPGVLPPGITSVQHRLPGESEDQPWTDAQGSEMQ